MCNVERTVRVNSLLASSLIAETNICAMISVFIPIPMISVLISCLILAISIYFNRHRLKVSLNCWFGYILFLFFLLVSMLINNYVIVSERLIFFLVFSTCALIINNLRFDRKLILRYLLYIYTVNLLIYFFRQRNVIMLSDDYWALQMGIAYSFVPPVIIGIMLLLNYKSSQYFPWIFSNKKINRVYYIVILSLSGYIILFDCGTRGAIIAFITAGFFILYKRLSKGQRIVFSITFFILIIFIYVFLDSIITLIITQFSQGDVKALAKLSMMTEAGDASNGRDDLYSIAYELIQTNPILGYGVGYYENITQTYVHQLFLESLLEWGIIGTIIFFLPILRLILVTKKEKTKFRYDFNILILTISFIPLLFSQSFWLYPPFWFGYYYAINIGHKQRLENNNNISKRIIENYSKTSMTKSI